MASPTRNAFARALETYISDIKRDEDPSSPFYTEVLSILSTTQSPPMASQVKRSEEQLIQLIQDLDSRQRRSSKIRRISDKLHPFVTGLSRYTNCCDVLIQAAPSAAVLLYGGARIVLQLAEKFHNCFETVLSIMEDVGKLLDCYNLFAKAYEASADMQQLLVETYKNIVSFWQKATKLFSRKAYKTLLRGIVKPLDAEWQKCRQALEDDSKHVARFAQATEADLARQRDEERALHQQAKLRRQIVDWIKGRDDDVKLDTRPDLRQNLETRYQDTCEWFFEQPGVEAWLVAKKSTAIWYSAGPGTGKTITASGLAHRLQDEGRRTATFFCSFNDVVRRKTITVFRSIALQLLSTSDSIPERVKRLYEEDLTHHCSNLTDIRVALEVVEHLIKQLPRIHIIVDGLDECADRRELLAAICHLLHAKTYGIVKWFFSSRGDSDIRNALRRHEVIEIEARQDCLMSDIRKYLTPRLHCDECVDHWTSLSDGNFLWMSHMLPVIEGETSTCAEDLEEELKTFPKGLTGCYARSLAHLSKRPEKHQQLARRIFTMVVGAVQPLRLRELTHALAASKGTSDYSERSLPRMELIEELCSNLIKFDRGTNGTDDDPVLKVIHKSVQDFFLQNPESLDLPDASLRQYFVTSEAANLELGQSALSYLSYVRYNRPQDVSALMKNKEHAFLQHAAIFWYRYLDDATSSRSLSAKVVDFVRSEAFWTCVAVQAQIAPHLFALYTNTGCGFTIQATGPQKDKELDKVAYAIPLPDWLESGEYGTEGPQIMETFHKFVMEWHPVLNSHRSAVNECAMDFEWLMNMPGRITWQSSRVKFFTVPGTHSSSKALPISIIDLAIESEEVLIRTLERHDIPARYTFGTIQFPDTSVISLEGIKVESAYSVTAPVSADLYAFSVSDDLQKKFWLVDISSVKARQITADSEEINVQELLLQNPPPGRHTTRRWSLNCRASNVTLLTGVGSHSTVAFHCSQDRHTTDREPPSSQESGYGSMASSDNGSDSGSDSEVDDETSESSSPTQDCMFIFQDDGPPVWHYWKSTVGTEAPCAFHPTKRLAVWSSCPHEIFIVDFNSGKVRSRILPEPVNAQFSTVRAMRKEFHFSASGETINYLLYTATKTTAGIRHLLCLSSFSFALSELDEEGGVILESTSPVNTVSYECTGPIQHPFILTSWELDSVYAAVPPSSCNPKIVRMKILGADATTSSTHPTDDCQTLHEPVYFPYSVPYRAPQLKVLSRTPQEQILALTLDAEFAPATGLGGTDAEIRKPPAIMTWDLSRQNDWRKWNDKLDGRDQSVKDNESTYAMLRGSFVDAGRRFEVPVRSGLDWRRKAFLSCA